jgi:outer membrane protein TolC
VGKIAMRHRLQAVFLLAPALCLPWGCVHPCQPSQADAVPEALAELPPNDAGSSLPVPAPGLAPPPTTVRDLDRTPTYIRLSEAIAIALEKGRVGSPAGNGLANEGLVVFAGRTVAGSDSIRVLTLDPAIYGTDIEAALSKFDAHWTSSMTWTRHDVPVANLIDTFQNGDAATLKSSLLKPLPTGGVAGITFQTDYEFLANPTIIKNPLTGLPQTPLVNPYYRPRLQFQFEQPLLQAFGVEINQLRPTHPGSILTPFQTSSRVEGILITRLRFDEERAEFEGNVSLMILNVEMAYWNLYDSYYTLYSREQSVLQALETMRITKAKVEEGSLTHQDLAQARQQYELSRGQRLTALGDVLERERQLRELIGLPLDDGRRLVPYDNPVVAPYQPAWDVALADALEKRPELVLARQDLKYRQLDLIYQKNALRPDLRFVSTYDVNGMGTELGGTAIPSGPNFVGNAFRSLGANEFHNWSVGLTLDIPVGYRDAHAAVRAAFLNLRRSYLVLRDQEDKVRFALGQHYRHVIEYYDQIEIQHAQRLAAATQLELRSGEYASGRGTTDLLLQSQRGWADALKAENDAIIQYNMALASFEFTRGTILEYDNVHILEGPLPLAVAQRAEAHQRQRQLALELRQRPAYRRLGCEGPPAGLELAPADVAWPPALVGRHEPGVPPLHIGATLPGGGEGVPAGDNSATVPGGDGAPAGGKDPTPPGGSVPVVRRRQTVPDEGGGVPAPGQGRTAPRDDNGVPSAGIDSVEPSDGAGAPAKARAGSDNSSRPARPPYLPD